MEPWIFERSWIFENGIEVYEVPFDGDLRCLEVYNKGKYLGGIYPNSEENMELCIKDLDEGFDPVTAGWYDGMGNACCWEGWERDPEEEEEEEDEEDSWWV